jgi:transposase-like protein
MRKIEPREDRRAAVLRELEQSGLSMAEFCRRRDLPYGTVAAWRSTARREPVRFVEVEAAPAGRPHDQDALCAELLLPGGAVLRVYQHRGRGGAA